MFNFITSVPGVIVLILITYMVYLFGGGIFSSEAASNFQFIKGLVSPIMMGLG